MQGVLLVLWSSDRADVMMLLDTLQYFLFQGRVDRCSGRQERDVTRSSVEES